MIQPNMLTSGTMIGASGSAMSLQRRLEPASSAPCAMAMARLDAAAAMASPTSSMRTSLKPHGVQSMAQAVMGVALIVVRLVMQRIRERDGDQGTSTRLQHAMRFRHGRFRRSKVLDDVQQHQGVAGRILQRQACGVGIDRRPGEVEAHRPSRGSRSPM